MNELALVRAAQAGDRDAMDRLLRRYAPRVEAIARRYARPRVPAEDLAQDGLLELFKAIKRFEPGGRARLWTYARYSVEHAIKRSARGGNVIKLPVRVAALIPKVDATRAALREALGREPTVAELSSELDLTEEQIFEVERRALEMLLLEELPERPIEVVDPLELVDGGEHSWGASEAELLLKAYPRLLSRMLGSRGEVYGDEAPVAAGSAGSWLHLRLLDLAAALRQMPDKLFATVELVGLREVPAAEAATRLGVSERTVYYRYRQGLKWLADSLRKRDHGWGVFHVTRPPESAVDAVAECARRYRDALAAIAALDRQGGGERYVRWVVNAGTCAALLSPDPLSEAAQTLIVLGELPATSSSRA